LSAHARCSLGCVLAIQSSLACCASPLRVVAVSLDHEQDSAKKHVLGSMCKTCPGTGHVPRSSCREEFQYLFKAAASGRTPGSEPPVDARKPGVSPISDPDAGAAYMLQPAPQPRHGNDVTRGRRIPSRTDGASGGQGLRP
jgi:hypothetical protein